MEVVASLAVLPIWVGGLSQLLGMPVAWLRLRGTAAWQRRPPAVRRIDLLAAYMRPVTERAIAAAIVAALILVALWFLSGQDSGAVWALVSLILVYALPLALVPLAVVRIDPGRLSRLDLYEQTSGSA